jgi:hypothetical protein
MNTRQRIQDKTTNTRQDKTSLYLVSGHDLHLLILSFQSVNKCNFIHLKKIFSVIRKLAATVGYEHIYHTKMIDTFASSS